MKLFLPFVISWVLSSQAWALSTLKQIQVTSGSQVDLLFDSRVRTGQVKVEYFNDTIQLSLSEAAVYPAKISSIRGGVFTKIFAYQYAPKLVRCRLTVNGKADALRKRLRLKPSGRILTVRLEEQGSDEVALRSAQATHLGDGHVDTGTSGLDEKALLDHVLKSSVPQPAPQLPGAVVKPSQSSEPLAEGKPLPNPLGVFGKFMLIVGLFCALAFAVKRMLRRENPKGMLGAITRFARKNLGRPEKMIEVVSTHYLGPKKSIAVVRIAGRTLVLGVSNDSINLITQIGASPSESESWGNVAEVAAERALGTGATAAGDPVFSELLEGEENKPAISSGPNRASIRAQIRNRLEGFKPL